MTNSTTLLAPNAVPAAATWPVLTELSTDAAQQVFHTIMEAMSRPGTIHSIADQAPNAPVPAAVTPLLTLVDLMTPVTVLDTPNVQQEEAQEIAGIISRLTGGPIAAPSDTRFALALEEPRDFADLNRGSHWSPEYGAMLVQRVTGVAEAADGADAAGAIEIVLTGPGIHPERPTTRFITGLSADWFVTRASLTDSYPAGIDCLLITDEGDFIAIPRTTRIEVR